MSLPQEILVVSARVDAAVEQDWNRWYDEVHLPEIVACPGFRSGQRYVAEDRTGARRYIAVYELDHAGALASPEFATRRGWGPFAGKVEFETLRFSRLSQVTK
jgi:hypothetical protein